ncbi:alpha-N-arabinofuranosidase [Exophiala viscosa]|uniref:Alpha-N-arabinofuranosidase n=1 Tax=Exophiala viscosa TaxID=2486360 RepID=A0AAN6E3Q2_9EURO|nr:alpha-N-arabinofuranosidase [Exophiala viscosa]
MPMPSVINMVVRPQERQPLLPHPSHPSPGYNTLSLINQEKGSLTSSTIHTSQPSANKRLFLLALRTKIILIMVAIPAFLLASSAVTSLGPLTPRDTVIRSPQPAEPQTTSNSNLFASVQGPLISTQFADPAIIHVNGISYAFATNNKGVGADRINVQVATSTDNETWTLMDHHDALPSMGAWETGAGVWAPDVVQVEDGSFVLYYADVPTWAPQHHCVGAATSKNITGPYAPLSQPFACPNVLTQGGAIDPDGFHDVATDKRYVVYKVDGNSLGHGGACMNSVAPIIPTPLMLQEVAADGVTPIGNPVELLDRDDVDGPLIEAPALHRSPEGVYFLFYSSNCFTTPKYDVSYATATNVLGPYTRSNRPLLITSDAGLVGPGGMDIIKGGGTIVFHGHMTIANDPAELKQAEAIAASTGTSVNSVSLPLIRGMWSATAQFSGTTVSLA